MYRREWEPLLRWTRKSLNSRSGPKRKKSFIDIGSDTTIENTLLLYKIKGTTSFVGNLTKILSVPPHVEGTDQVLEHKRKITCKSIP